MRKSHHGSAHRSNAAISAFRRLRQEKLKLKAVRVTAVFKASLGKIVRRVR